MLASCEDWGSTTLNPRELWQCFWLLPSFGLGETPFKPESTTGKTICYQMPQGLWMYSTTAVCTSHSKTQVCSSSRLFQKTKLQLSTGCCWPLYCFNSFPVSPFWDNIHPCVGSLILLDKILLNLHSFRLSLHIVPGRCLSDVWTQSCSLLGAEHLLDADCWVLPVKQDMDIMATSLG